MTTWHKIQGYNKDLTYDANKKAGVDLPDLEKDVLVIYPEISKNQVYVKKSDSYGMTGTLYYDGTLWAYFDMPVW